jgi:predicted membrane protein
MDTDSLPTEISNILYFVLALLMNGCSFFNIIQFEKNENDLIIWSLSLRVI